MNDTEDGDEDIENGNADKESFHLCTRHASLSLLGEAHLRIVLLLFLFVFCLCCHSILCVPSSFENQNLVHLPSIQLPALKENASPLSDLHLQADHLHR